MSPEIKTIPLTSDQRDVAMTICELQHQIALRFGVAPGQQQLVVHACAGVTDDNAAKVAVLISDIEFLSNPPRTNRIRCGVEDNTLTARLLLAGWHRTGRFSADG